jgi:DNA-nicking Smr family endonuclease
MPRKKRPDTHPAPPQFRSTPFGSLKGVLPASAPPAAKQPAPAIAEKPAEENSAEIFLRAMEGVRQLDSGATVRGTPASRQATPETRTSLRTAPASVDDTAAVELFMQEIGRLKLEVQFTETLPDEDELKPLAGNRLRQLKRGIVSVDHQLDLHGLTREEALDALPRFLRSARTRGRAAVLVITGKGNNSPGEPVLQQAVASWLRDAGRELVVEFTPAPREMGGSGAFVVFLRPLPKQSAKPS